MEEIKDNDTDSFFFNGYEKIEKGHNEIIDNESEINDDYNYEIIPKGSLFKRTHNTGKYLCIELKNNNKLYIKYEEYWTVEDVSNTIIIVAYKKNSKNKRNKKNIFE